jgi:hypothetical protein
VALPAVSVSVTPSTAVAGAYTGADVVYPNRTLDGPNDPGHTNAGLLNVEPHGHGEPVQLHDTGTELLVSV